MVDELELRSFRQRLLGVMGPLLVQSELLLVFAWLGSKI